MQFEDIYRQYYQDVYYYLLSLCGKQETAEELTQETFFRAMKSIHKFKGECQLRVWLCQIAKNAYLSKIKKERREVWMEEAEDTSQSVLAEAGAGNQLAGADAPGGRRNTRI